MTTLSLSLKWLLAAIVFFLGFAWFGIAQAAIVTWDGGGADTNWGTCANWSSNVCPTSADIATFDATSTKNATINAALTGGTAPAGIDINVGYSGTISQSSGQSITVGASNFDQAAGTFTASDAAMTVNGSFILSGGTFTAPTAANLSVQNDWTHTVGGTFNHNNGTVRFINAVSTTIDVNTTESFYNLTQDKSSNVTVTAAASDTIVVLNALTLNDGRLMSNNTSSIFDLKGTISTVLAWDSGNANFKFSGTTDQSLSLTSPSSWDPIGGLTIDKVSGNFTLGTALTLDCGGTSCNTTLTRGTFDVNGFAFRTNDFTHTAGTFTSGAATIDVDDDLVISAGTWNASTGNTTLGGDFTVAVGATFNDNSGNFTFDTNQDQTANVDVTETFTNLTINKGNYQETITSGDTLIVTGSLNLTDGRFFGGTINMQGATTTIATTYDSGTTLLKFSGTATQTLTLGHASANNFDGSITVDKAGGTLSLGSALVLDYTSPTFTLTQGTFSTGNYSFTTHYYTQNGGTFDGGSSTVNVNGVFTLTGGTYNASSAVTRLSDTYTHNAGGTFNHNNGTWKFAAISDRTYDVATSETFYNLTIEQSGTIGTIPSGDTFIVLNTLTCTNGRFGTGTLELRGDVVIEAGCDSASAPLLFSGSNTQTFTTSVNMVDADITINKSGGQVNQGSAINLDCANCDLTIQEGTYDLNGYNLSVTAGGTEKIVVETGGNLQLQGGETITADSASYPQLDVGSTVTYDGTGVSYTMKDWTYQHLAIAGGASSVFALAANESLGGNLTITSGTLDQATRSLAVTGTFSNNSVLRRRQTEAFTGTMDVDSGTVEYVGDGDGSVEDIAIADFGGTDYYNLKINDVNGTKDTFSLGGGLVAAGTFEIASSTFAQGIQSISTGALTVNGGTFTGGSSAITVSGPLTLSAGTLTGTSNTMSVGGSWTHTAGGTFTHNGGTVSFTGTAATIDVATLETFSALTINKDDGQTLTVASGDTLLATGVLSLTNGGFATGTLVAQGNIGIGVSWDAGGTGLLQITGGNTQVIDSSAGAGILDNPVQIDKTAGTVMISDPVTLDHPNADWTLTLGAFSTDDEQFTTTAGSDVLVSNGTWSNTSSAVVLGGALTVAGGTYDAGTGSLTTSGTVTISGGALEAPFGDPTFNGPFVLSSGSYVGADNGDSFTGGLTISGGTFTASNATTTVAGSWTHTAGGTFTHNGGTVSFTGGAATVDVATSETFATLVINKTNAALLTIAAGDTLQAQTSLTLTNGAVGTGTLEAVSGVTVGSGFDGGNAGLKFTGGASQTFTLTGATAKFDGDIEVAKSGGTVSLGSDLVMDATGQDLVVTSGSFSTSGTNYGLTVAGNVTLGGGTFLLNDSTVDVNGNVTVTSGTWDMGSASLFLAGDVSYSAGTMTAGTSSATLDGTDQEIIGATTWYDLAKNGVTAATLTLPASTITTVNGALTLSGAASQLLSLRSSTDGVQHTITVNGAGTLSYVDVKDSFATLPLRCMVSTSGCVDSGGNTGWTFTIASGGSAIDPSSTIGEALAARMPVVVITTPNGGEAYTAGDLVNITWSTTNGGDIVTVSSSMDGGQTWDVLAKNIANEGVYTWEIPATAQSLESVIKVETTDLAVVTAQDTSDEVFSITTVMTEEMPISPEEEEEVSQIAERLADLPAAVTVHGLIKLADDGNPETQADSAVYYVGADGKRHAFPNEYVYETWFCGFDNVRVVSQQELASIALGVNVTYKPGVRMIKFISVPKVYAVDRLGVLRWISSESIAKALYGSTWNTLIDDVSDAFYGNYEFGTDILDSGEYSAQEALSEAIYPSDNISIPGYVPSSTEQTLSCE